MQFKYILASLLLFSSMLYSKELSKDSASNSFAEYELNREYSFEHTTKSPKGALLRSCVLPGWGMAYAHNRRGIIAIAEIVGATGLTISPIVNGINYREDKGDFIAGLYIAGGLAFYLYQIIYSYNAAIEYNKRNYYSLLIPYFSLNYIQGDKNIVLNIALRL